MHSVRLQQRGQRIGIGRVKAQVNVVNAKAEFVAQHACGADVGRNHGFLDNPVRDATRFCDDIEHFTFFAENEAVVWAIFKHQRMLMTPLTTAQANTLQQTNLLGDFFTFRLPATAVFQPVRDVVISQFCF